MSTVVIKDEPVGPGGADGSPPPGHADNSLPSRPAHVPEKFWDAEKGEVRMDDVLKSYSELEKRFSAPKQEPAPAAQEPAQTDEQQADVSNILIANGLDPERYTVEVEQNGGLSDESYAELAQAGFPQEMVDQYLAGRGLHNEAAELLSKQALDDVFASVGGPENFQTMAAWAAQNVGQRELETYNDMVNSGNPAQAKAAVTWIKSMYTEANGSEPNLLNGDSRSEQGADPYLSTAQLTAAMRDPRYRSDPAYRQEVIQRLAVSKIM